MLNRRLPSFTGFLKRYNQTAKPTIAPKLKKQEDPLFRKLLYRCNHRGMVENEIILTSFVENNYSKLEEPEVALLERLLDEPDPAMYKWFTRAIEAEPEYRGSKLLEAIQEHTRTMNR